MRIEKDKQEPGQNRIAAQAVGQAAAQNAVARGKPRTIGVQPLPPFRRAFHIAVQGIRIRLGRSLVTLSGVALGTAFLMSTVTAQFVDRAVGRERELRRQVDSMVNVLRGQIGTVENKVLTVFVCGALSPEETAFLERIRSLRPAALRVMGAGITGFDSVSAPELARDAAAVLLLGDASSCPVPLATLTGDMLTPLVIDSRPDREVQYGPTVRREVFFGPQSEDRRLRETQRAVQERYRLVWIIAISLAVTVIGVANALLMSVTERFREIGTMKCLGALSVFIRRLFLIESALIGLAGSVVGVLTGTLLTLMAYASAYGVGLVFGAVERGGLLLASMLGILIGTVLAIVAALYPARVAARMVPAAALRSTV